MRRIAVLVLPLAILQVVSANALVLCARRKADGTIDGALRARPACKPREVVVDPVALGLQGPQGPQGLPGPAGPTGPQGPQGGELPWVDVKQYGATGDGTTDDTAAILSAIAAVPANGTVFFPPGNYRISDELPINTRLNILGSGQASQIYQSADKSLFVFGPWYLVQGISVRDLYLGSAATSPGTALLKLVNTHRSRFDNIIMLGSYYGVHLYGSLLNTFVNLKSGINLPNCVTPSYCTPHGFFGATSANQSWVFAERDGVASSGPLDVLVSSNANTFLAPSLEGGTNGIWIEDTNAEGNLFVYGGSIEGVSNVGLYVKGTFLPSIVSGVHFEANGVADVQVDDARNVRIQSVIATKLIKMTGAAKDVAVESSAVNGFEIGSDVRRVRIENVAVHFDGQPLHLQDQAPDTTYAAVSDTALQATDPNGRYSTLGIGVLNPDANSSGGTPGRLVDVDGEVRATAFSTGDIVFRKDGKDLWRLFEDERGLHLTNVRSGETSRLFLEKDVAALAAQAAEAGAQRALAAQLGPACWAPGAGRPTSPGGEQRTP